MGKFDKQFWVMIAGPYCSGAISNAERTANLRRLNLAALAVIEKGHVPIVGVNNALPLITLAGDSSFDRLMMPLSLALSERCDCCVRIGGASKGADQEVDRFRAQNKPVYFGTDELP